MTPKEELKAALIAEGYDAVSDFLGHDFDKNLDVNAIGKLLDERLANISIESFVEFYLDYVGKINVCAYDIMWDTDGQEVELPTYMLIPGEDLWDGYSVGKWLTDVKEYRVIDYSTELVGGDVKWL